jgi:ubiquinone/menaquinone biosynthesis C-methylase UbiE
MNVKGFQDTIDWYDQNAEEYANLTYQVTPDALLEKFISLLPTTPLVLDAGCSAGRDSRLLKEKGAVVTGLDISKGLLAQAKKRHPDISFIEGNFLDLPFEDNSFDGVWSRASLVHLDRIKDLKQSLKEFYRVLKDKGILHIYTREQTEGKKTALVSDRDTPHKRFFRYYTKDEMKKYLEDLGFVIKKIESHSDPHGRKEIKWLCIFAQKF